MQATPLIEEAYPLLETAPTRPAHTGQCAIHPLVRNATVAAYLLGRRAATAAADAQIDRVELFQRIDQAFGRVEVETLCFELGLDHEALPGSTKREKARELVIMLERHGRLGELSALCATKRPNISWPQAAAQPDENALVPQLDLAVVVDIARPALHNVAQYLDQQSMRASFVVLRAVRPGFLSVEDDWEAAVSGFAAAMNVVKRTHAGARTHFFLAGPGPILFGMGCIWGTVDEGDVYHYDKGTYHHVIHISRQLR